MATINPVTEQIICRTADITIDEPGGLTTTNYINDSFGPGGKNQVTPLGLNLNPGAVAVANWSALQGAQQTSAQLLTAVSNQISQQLAFIAPADLDISALQIGLPAFLTETLNENYSTVTMQWRGISIEYPTGVTLMKVTYDGNTTVTVPPARRTKWSDPANLIIPAGSVFTVRMFGFMQGVSLPVYAITVAGGAISIGGVAFSTLTWSNGLLYGNAALAHNVPVGQTFPVVLAGQTPSTLVGTFSATSTGTTSFTIPLANNPGSITVVGTYTSPGQGLQTALTVALTALGAGTGGAITFAPQYAVAPRVLITNIGTTQYTSAPTVTSSGGGGTLQPTWQAVVINGYLSEVIQLTPGSTDFTSAPALAFSGGGGVAGAATCTLYNGRLSATPGVTAGSGYTNGTYVLSQVISGGGLALLMGSQFRAGTPYRQFFYNTPATAADVTNGAGLTLGGNTGFISMPIFIKARTSAFTRVFASFGTSIHFGLTDVAMNQGQVFGMVNGGLSGESKYGGNGGITGGGCYVNLCKPSSTLAGLLGSGRGAIDTALEMGVTDIICDHGINDFQNGVSAAQFFVLFQRFVDIWLSQGIRVWWSTALPRTTSVNGWLDIAGQTLVQPVTGVIQTWNNQFLRPNSAQYGIRLIDDADFFEFGGAANPTGFWDVSGFTGSGAGFYATLTGDGVSAVTLGTPSGGAPTDTGYLSGGSGTANLQFVGGNPGSGAAATVVVNAGVANGAITVTAPGSGYPVPPLVLLPGALTTEGTHPSTYGYGLGRAQGDYDYQTLSQAA